MNKILKLSGNLNRMLSAKLLLFIIALVAMIGLSMAACDNGTTDSGGTTGQGGSGNPGNQGGYKTYTAYDEAGNAFILVVTENDTYVLS